MILNEHCILENKSNEIVELKPCSNTAMCYVNGKRVEDRTMLKSGDRVIFGKSHVFRFINPEQVRKEKNASTSSNSNPNQLSDNLTNNNNGKFIKKNLNV